MHKLLAVACAALIAGAGAAQEPQSESTEEAVTRTVKMTAENFKFVPDTIRVAKGTKVRIEFKSYDASHSFVLKAYGLKVQLPEGSTQTVEFVADRAGEFRWKCGRPCGNGCPKMRGKLVVIE